jgi:HptB-dependent secretion and biofilm anti anti-sigma factor
MSDNIATLHPSERFDFSSYRKFRESYEPALENPRVKSIIIDLSHVQYIDSAALGIMLLLRDKARMAGKQISIANPKGAVKELLDIANFNKLFSVN